MAQMIEINLRPDQSTLRQFGWIALVGFGILATIAWQEWLIFSFGLGEARPIVAGVFVALAAWSAFFSLVWPRANLPVYIGLTILSYPIGFVLSSLIMGTLFFVLITPLGIFFKMTGRDSLKRKFEPDLDSYWIDSRAPRAKESYFKQF